MFIFPFIFVYMFVYVPTFIIIVEILNPRIDDMLYIFAWDILFVSQEGFGCIFSLRTHTFIIAYHERSPILGPEQA